jgi:hypothetical protein
MGIVNVLLALAELRDHLAGPSPRG